MLNYRSPLERLCIKLYAMAKADAIPLVSGMVSGLLAHMFVITNKLMNADEVGALFSKGATIDSGRWALELLRLVFPDVSLPWLWGIITVFLITVSACITLRIFRVKHNFHRVLLPALFVSFPSLTGTMCFMFTTSSYAVAFLLAVLSVWVFVNMKKRLAAWLLSAVFLIFSVGIYQAYVAISASFFVLLMLQKLLEGEDAKKVFGFGFRCVALLLVSLVVYYAISALAVHLSNGEFLTYAIEAENSLLMKVLMAYNALVKSIVSGYFGFVNSGLSFVAHIAGLAICAFLAIKELLKLRDIKKCLLVLLCIILLPLSMNCIFLISSTQIIHSLVLYSFVVIYVFAVILLDRVEKPAHCLLRDAVVVCMLLTVINNVFFANKVYLKLHVQYENAYAFYTGLMTEVYEAEGYDKDCRLVLIGNQSGLYMPEELDTGDLFGPNENLVNIYTNDYFIRNYMGYYSEFVSGDEYWALRGSEEFEKMPAYPSEGSVKRIEDYIVVKLG